MPSGWRWLSRRSSGSEFILARNDTLLSIRRVGLKANVDLPQWQELLREARARVETISVDGAASLYSYVAYRSLKQLLIPQQVHRAHPPPRPNFWPLLE